VLLVFSAHANDSPQVRREIERAVSKGKIIVPFRIEDVLPSDAMEFALSNTHWLDALTPPMERYLLQLCNTIARLIEKHTVAEAPLWKPEEAADEEAERKAREAEEARVREAEEHRAREAREAEQARLRDAAESEAQKEEERKALEAKQANGGAKATAKPTVGSTPRVVAPRTAKAEIEEPKSGSHRLPGWAWGGLAVVVVVVVLALGHLLYKQMRYAQADLACVSGNAGACTLLGNMNEDGEGVAKDDARAAGLYSKACDGGDADGCSYLGNLYRFGVGVAEDPDKARQLFTKSCNMGDQMGCNWLKEMQSDTNSNPAAAPASVLQGSATAPASNSNQPGQEPDLHAAVAEAPAPASQTGSAVAGTLRGHIADPTGSPIAGATVTIDTSAGTFVKSTTADASGSYSVGGLEAGGYIVHVTSGPPFAPFTSPAIQLLPGQSKRVDVSLDVQ
jgi:TPR repeat protein